MNEEPIQCGTNQSDVTLPSAVHLWWEVSYQQPFGALHRKPFNRLTYAIIHIALNAQTIYDYNYYSRLPLHFTPFYNVKNWLTGWSYT
ncbi:hypothetical protein E2C01_102444 [Portunus trituberculatus]|uniref:Uncharacterized protein n=1 Tax=Portunus trituberculatus TaxID=210409 RepID=A0A5B7KCM1_PORTR|nr:hypothetical protein [Portunus trituberculatus]